MFKQLRINAINNYKVNTFNYFINKSIKKNIKILLNRKIMNYNNGE